MLDSLIVDKKPGVRPTTWGPSWLEDVDVAPLLSSKGLEKTHRGFSKTPYKFNFIVTDQVKNAFITDPEKMTPSEQLKHKHYLSQVAIPDHITCIITNNVTSKTRYVPLTPWMLMHRLGHAASKLLDCGNNKFDAYEYSVRAAVIKIQVQALKAETFNWRKNKKAIMQTNFGYSTDTLNVSPTVIASNLFTMHSARSNRLGGQHEWGPECLAQYVINGKVTFNRYEDWKIPFEDPTKDPVWTPRRHWDSKPPTGKLPILCGYEIALLNQSIERYERVVNHACKASLDFMVGKVLRF